MQWIVGQDYERFACLFCVREQQQVLKDLCLELVASHFLTLDFNIYVYPLRKASSTLGFIVIY